MDEKALQKQVHRAKVQNVVTCFVFLSTFLIVLISALLYWYRRHFTVEKWHRDVENRHQIVDSLLEQYPLIGMQESEVIALLGEEDSERCSFKISRAYFPPDTSLVYDLGVSYMDNIWLILSLQNGQVSAYCMDVS